MTTTILDREERIQDLPRDLRQRVGARALIGLALEAVQLAGDQLPRLNAVAGSRHSPRMLLTLLTYCYAAGILSSEDIEWACRNNSAARYICANTSPDWETIRRFRRANRPWIEECLAWVYGAACAARPAEVALAAAPAPVWPALPDAGIGAFVRRKLQLAIMMDTAMCD